MVARIQRLIYSHGEHLALKLTKQIIDYVDIIIKPESILNHSSFLAIMLSRSGMVPINVSLGSY